MNTNQTTTTSGTIEIKDIAAQVWLIRQGFSTMPYSGIAHFLSMPEVRREADLPRALDAIRVNLATLAEVLRSVAESHRKTEAELEVHREAIAGLATLKRLLAD